MPAFVVAHRQDGEDKHKRIAGNDCVLHMSDALLHKTMGCRSPTMDHLHYTMPRCTLTMKRCYMQRDKRTVQCGIVSKQRGDASVRSSIVYEQ